MPANSSDTPVISICMVSLNCLGVLKDCLESLWSSDLGVPYEVTIVDNGSTDGTQDYVRRIPQIRLIENNYNAGFTKGTNQGIVASSGRYLLWLNTDTILRKDSLQILYDFMERTPKAGISGPRVLNADGSFQPQCKRGVPTPFASFCYVLRLDRIWPRNPRVSQYLLRHLADDEPVPVDSVSGCCLFARREVWNEIGPLDDSMFGFGEDVEWCVRAKKSGWEVWYYPESVIVHLKGHGGAHSKPFRKIWGMHQGLWFFYRKHLKAQYSALTTAIFFTGIAGSLVASTAGTWLRRSVAGWRSWIRRRSVTGS